MIRFRKKNFKKTEVFLKIWRQKDADTPGNWQVIRYETEDEGETAASALTNINEAGDYKDQEGKPVSAIRWDCSCLQKRCGACAMLLNGRPGLACSVFLREYHGKTLSLEPLRKFPMVSDLSVDRTILFENLKTMEIWGKKTVEYDEVREERVYDASRCLQCGCCLEVCPNFAPGDSFFGAAGFVPASRLLHAMSGEEREKMQRNYEKHGYAGCGKSLACAAVCPAGIEIEKLLVRSNHDILKQNRQKLEKRMKKNEEN